MIRYLRTALVISFLAFFVNCGGGDSSTSTPATSTTVTLSIINNSTATIKSLWIGLSSDPQWAEQLSSSSKTIAATKTFNLTGIPAGTYDFAVSTAVYPADPADSTLGNHSWIFASKVFTAGSTFVVTINDANRNFSIAADSDDVSGTLVDVEVKATDSDGNTSVYEENNVLLK